MVHPDKCSPALFHNVRRFSLRLAGSRAAVRFQWVKHAVILIQNPQAPGDCQFGLLRRMTVYHILGVMDVISSIDELVAFFGGDTALAEFLGTTQSAVAQWKIRGQIAAGWHLRLLAELTRRGQIVSPCVFGLTEKEAAGLFPPPPVKRRQHVAA